jgi:hypothetical protein
MKARAMKLRDMKLPGIKLSEQDFHVAAAALGCPLPAPRVFLFLIDREAKG